MQHNRVNIEEWIAHLNRSGKSSNTIAAYRRALDHFVHWHQVVYGELPFEYTAILPRDVRDWKSHQQRTEKASPASVNQRLVALNQFFGWAQQQGYCSSNPCQEIEPLQLDRPKPQALKPHEVRRLLRAAYAHSRDYAILELMVGTGLRVSELLALQIGDIELRERSGKVIVRYSKGAQYREIPLTRACRHALQRYLDNAHPSPSDSFGALWYGKKGPLKHRSSVMRMLQKYGNEIGLTGLHPHQLRHTFAMEYLRTNPDDLRGLARLLGHTNLNTVMIYTEPSMGDLAQRMERMEWYPGDEA